MAKDNNVQSGSYSKARVVEGSYDTFGSLLRKCRRAKRLTQDDLGTHSFLGNTTISRLETGKQLPRWAVFKRLSSALGLPANEQENLALALQRDILQKKSVPSELYLQADDLGFLASEQVESVRKLRLAGKPQFAAAEATRYARWIRKFVRRTRRDSDRNALLESLANLLMEQSKSYMDYLFPHEVWWYAEELIKEQQDIAQRISDPKLHLLPSITTEAALYVSGDYEKAHRVCSQLLKDKSKLDSRWQPELLRAGAINAGYLGDNEGIAQISDYIEPLIEESDPMTCTFVLEGLARGQGSVGNDKSFKTLERAWTLLETGRRYGNYSSLRSVQLIRTQLKVMRTLGDTSKAEFQRLGTQGLLICDELGYLRYRKEITQLLESFLN